MRYVYKSIFFRWFVYVGCLCANQLHAMMHLFGLPVNILTVFATTLPALSLSLILLPACQNARTHTLPRSWSLLLFVRRLFCCHFDCLYKLSIVVTKVIIRKKNDRMYYKRTDACAAHIIIYHVCTKFIVILNFFLLLWARVPIEQRVKNALGFVFNLHSYIDILFVSLVLSASTNVNVDNKV